jgi:hypothetical protein
MCGEPLFLFAILPGEEKGHDEPFNVRPAGMQKQL